LSRLSPTCESLFQPEKPPKKAAAGKIACPTTKAEGWTKENHVPLGGPAWHPTVVHNSQAQPHPHAPPNVGNSELSASLQQPENRPSTVDVY
jgi:hypothetical protein